MCFSETLVSIHRTTWFGFPEDSNCLSASPWKRESSQACCCSIYFVYEMVRDVNKSNETDVCE
jgi:hypothetical protein